jgi:hypothetical protein
MSKIIVVAPEFCAYGGAHVLHRDDLGTASEDLPDAKVASLGEKRVINPELLKPFGKLRARAWARAARRGIRILDGYGQNPEWAKTVVQSIQEVCQEAQQHADHIVNNWSALVNDWANQNPKWSDMIRKSAPPREWVRDRFRFSVRAYPLGLDVLEDMGIEDNALLGEMGGLGDRLVAELVDAANALWKEFLTREKVTSRQISPLVTMQEKAETLGYLDRRAAQVGTDLGALLKTLPPKGPYETHLPAILQELRKVVRLGFQNEAVAPATPEHTDDTPVWACA